MANKLMNIGLQYFPIGVYQRLPQALPFENFYSLKLNQLQTVSHVRKLSLTSTRREEDEDRGEAPVKDPSKDRRVLVPVETSIRYLKSKAYKEAYGDKPVWFYYRRNHKGLIPPPPRQNCIYKGFISSGNPCPICRDEYLVLDYTNTKLLEQFISEYSGEVLPVRTAGLCAHQYETLLQAIEKAKDYGTITFDIPFRKYDYNDYVPKGLRFH